MKLTKITITGADESVDYKSLIDLSKEFPFVEWGILFSESSQGKKPRYPNFDWIVGLLKNINTSFIPVKLAAHLCGKYTRDLLKGNDDNIPIIFHVYDSPRFFSTFQLNAEYTSCEINYLFFFEIMKYYFDKREVIFQLRDSEENDKPFKIISEVFKNTSIKISGLVDQSGGTGKKISSYPMYEEYTNIGYAGGINPENIENTIETILQFTKRYSRFITSDREFWLDMESGVRTDDKFDLDKVRACLKIAEKYVTK